MAIRLGPGTRSVAAKGARIFPVGRLFRPVGGLRNSVDEAGMVAARGSRGAGPVRRPRTYSQRHGWRRAQQARDELHDSIVRDKQRIKHLHKRLQSPPKPSRAERIRLQNEIRRIGDRGRGKAKTVTAATDPETGITRAGRNHDALPDANGWGCAEKMALDEINAARAAMTPPRRALEPHEVDFSEAIEVGKNVGDRVQKPVDAACQSRTNPDQFPDGTQFYDGGPDDTRTWGRRFGI